MVYVAPVYAAGEAPIEEVNAEALAEKVKARGHRAVATVADAAGLAEALARAVEPGDMVVCLGAGDITKWAAGLSDALRGAMAEAAE
jgi:UDP-N-acetylmuramate--alanine ligase